MAGFCGIDPGIRRTGLGHVQRGRWAATATLRGKDGTSKDWPLLVATAQDVAAAAVAWCVQREPEVIAIETMADQGPKRKAYSHRHTTAALCQALYDGLVLAGWDTDRIRWQDASTVLSHGDGYGTIKYLLERGRAGIDAPAALNEHEASAVTHALWAEALAHAPMAGTTR